MNQEEKRFTAKFSEVRSTEDLHLLPILNQCPSIIEYVLYSNLLVFSLLSLKLSEDSLVERHCLLMSM